MYLKMSPKVTPRAKRRTGRDTLAAMRTMRQFFSLFETNIKPNWKRPHDVECFFQNVSLNSNFEIIIFLIMVLRHGWFSHTNSCIAQPPSGQPPRATVYRAPINSPKTHAAFHPHRLDRKAWARTWFQDFRWRLPTCRRVSRCCLLTHSMRTFRMIDKPTTCFYF